MNDKELRLKCVEAALALNNSRTTTADDLTAMATVLYRFCDQREGDHESMLEIIAKSKPKAPLSAELYKECIDHLTEGMDAYRTKIVESPVADFSWLEDWERRGRELHSQTGLSQRGPKAVQ